VIESPKATHVISGLEKDVNKQKMRMINESFFIFVIVYHCCPGKTLLFGLKSTAVLSFSNTSLKAGVIRTKPLTVGL
jgi:hypothetical protein